MKGKLVSSRKRLARRVPAVPRRKRKPTVTPPQSVNETPSEVSTSENTLILTLKKEYARLKEEIQHQLAMTRGHRESGNDIVDDANQVLEQSTGFALKQQLERLLAQVEHALRRFEEGAYGLCERCGQLIHPERLQALPYATLCISCARAGA